MSMKPLVCSAALVAGAVAALGAAGQQAVFRGASDLVRVFVTVTDRDDRLVTTLTQDQFEVRDKGKVQPIALFDNTPQPIQLILMLDVSGSMSGNLSLLRASSAHLFRQLRPDDVARVGTFGREVAISPEFTSDPQVLVDALPDEIPEDAPTPLWRAVVAAMDAFDAASDRRRVILVLSDGKDTGRADFRREFITQSDVADRARNENVMVYAVGLRSRNAYRPMPGIGAGGLHAMLVGDLPDPGLAQVALDSGGGYLELVPRGDLGEAFARVAEELHSQYLIGFLPPARDGKAHDIDVKVSEKGLKPRARKSYLAPKG
jgi:VWFA-related protein